MGRLFLVRHSQASFMSQNYDQLSALGETQARLLGEYWAQREIAFDRVCSGPAQRHRQTARIVADAYRKGGITFPSSVVAEEFDEFQGEAVLSQSLPQLLPTKDRIRELHVALQTSVTEADKRANFERLFEAVTSKWVNGEIVLPNVESWRDFCARVNRGMSSLLSSARKGEVAVIF